MPFSPNKLDLLTPNNDWEAAIPNPMFENWDAGIGADPFPSWRLRNINGQLIYTFDHECHGGNGQIF